MINYINSNINTNNENENAMINNVRVDEKNRLHNHNPNPLSSAFLVKNMSGENDGEENERNSCTVSGNIAGDGNEIDKVKRPNAILLYHHTIK